MFRTGGLPPEELRGLVTELVAQLRAVREENTALQGELARPKGLAGRPQPRPSGMAPAATAARGARGKTRRRGRGAKTSRLVIDGERVLAATPPPGARFEGYDDVVVQDPRLAPRAIRYRRQRWRTPDGRILAGFGCAGSIARTLPC